MLYKGLSYSLLVQWTSGEEMFELLAAMIKDHPIKVAVYAKQQGLLDTPGGFYELPMLEMLNLKPAQKKKSASSRA
jgi:hypothetical protein